MRSTIAAAIAVAFGIWMMAAPAVLGYSGAAATSDRIVGPTAAAAAWIAATPVTRSTRWVNVPLGAWTLISPLLLNHPTDAAVHAVVSGIALIVTALVIEPMPRSKFGGGWKALLRDEKANEAS